MNNRTSGEYASQKLYFDRFRFILEETWVLSSWRVLVLTRIQKEVKLIICIIRGDGGKPITHRLYLALEMRRVKGSKSECDPASEVFFVCGN